MEKGTKKKVYITEEEKEKCCKVQKAFEELYEIEDIVVVDAGKYGFIKLHYYEEYNFDINMVFTDSKKLFNDLWEEWRNLKLITLVEGTPAVEMEYKEIFESLPKKIQEEIKEKKRYFQQKSGL